MSKDSMLRGLIILAALSAGPFAGIASAQQPAATWSKAAPLPQPRNELAAATVNGKIYAFGGGSDEMKDGKLVQQYTVGFTSEYDPATDRWRERTRSPEGLTHQGIAVVNGKVYLMGGFGGGRHTLPSASVYSYDPATDKWEKLAPLSGVRGSVALATVGGMIHAIGGRAMGEESALATHEVYNPATNSWRSAAPLPSARDHIAIFVVDGKIHVVGGRTGDARTNIALHDVYDPSTDKWTSAPPMPTARSSLAFAEYHGLLFVAGGECRAEKSYDDVEAFDPKNNRWVKFPVLPVPLHGFAAAVAGDKLHFIGGSSPCGGSGKVADTLQLTLK